MYFCYWSVDIEDGKMVNFMSNELYDIGEVVTLPSGRQVIIKDYAVEGEEEDD